MKNIEELIYGKKFEFHFFETKSDEGDAIMLYIRPVNSDTFEQSFKEESRKILEDILDKKIEGGIKSYTKVHVVNKNVELQIQYIPS